MKRTLIAGLATAALVSGGLGLAGLGLAGVAQADGTTWCPRDGSYLAKAPWPGFDWTVCHHWHYDNQGGRPGQVDDDTGIFHPWDGFDPSAPPPPPNPPECIGLFPLPGADPSHCVI